jgi:hypothetical protein
MVKEIEGREMRTGIRKFMNLGVIAVLLGILIFGTLACTQGGKSPVLSDPFTNSMGYFTLEGYSRGFVPGQTYEFKLSLKNDTKEQWQGRYYAYLVDTKSVVLNIGEQTVDLGPASSIGSVIKMSLPEGFKEGAYGLALVFPGRGSSITTIRVGEDQSISAGPWLDPAALPPS